MYIKFTFQKCGTVIELTDPTYTSPPSYSYESPQIVDELPENTLTNMLISRDTFSEDKCYYMDCGNLDRETVEIALRKFNTETDRDFNIIEAEALEKEDMPFLKTMKQALAQASLQHEQTPKKPDAKPYFTNQNLLFAAGGVATGLGIVAIISKAYSM